MLFKCFRPGWGMTEGDYAQIEARDAEDAAVEYAEGTADAGEYPDRVGVILPDGSVKEFEITTDVAIIVYAHEVEG